jgi:hypothetical protein
LGDIPIEHVAVELLSLAGITAADFEVNDGTSHWLPSSAETLIEPAHFITDSRGAPSMQSYEGGGGDRAIR